MNNQKLAETIVSKLSKDCLRELEATLEPCSKFNIELINQISNKLISLHYPEAEQWMWNYCIKLGKFTALDGHNYDLGIYKKPNSSVSAAIVYSNKEGDYLSGDLTWNKELYKETLKRAKKRNLI